MTRQLSFTQTWEAFKDGSKTVTRRSSWRPKCVSDKGYWVPGWQTLKPGDVIEGIEWLPRWAPNGERWTCERCGWLGPTDPTYSTAVHEERDVRHRRYSPSCAGIVSVWRGPERLLRTEGHRRIVSVGCEFLYDITPEDVTAEGFPGRTPGWFHAAYCGWKNISDRPVNRIAFERV